MDASPTQLCRDHFFRGLNSLHHEIYFPDNSYENLYFDQTIKSLSLHVDDIHHDVALEVVLVAAHLQKLVGDIGGAGLSLALDHLAQELFVLDVYLAVVEHARKRILVVLAELLHGLGGDQSLEAGPEELLPVSGEVLVYLVAELFVVRKDGASVGAAEDLEEPLCVQLLELLVLLLDIAVIHLSNFLLPGTLLTIGFWEAAKLLVHELLHGYFHELLLEGVHIHVQLQGQLGEPGVVLGVRQHIIWQATSPGGCSAAPNSPKSKLVLVFI
ncbi:Hypothetical_protein [Hexamita inflata]|uniref:Hypothetical_protein n=1 Tax=Hexamita inflata TaxID=28002 RepID=A0AA86UN84_9EUKA|nr:Hypothetical protein HINF_LOCUS52665 [Hexamita inflata]